MENDQTMRVVARDPHEFLAEQAQAVAARWSSQCDELRASAAAWGKGVLTVGTVIIGGFGLSNVTEVFPIDGHFAWLYAALTLGSVLLMALAAVWLARRLSRASRSIVMSPDLDEMRRRLEKSDDSAKPHIARLDDNSFTGEELTAIEYIYDEFAELNRPRDYDGKYSVKEYYEIALDIERRAESASAPDRDDGQQRLPRAAQIRAEVYATQAKAMATVVRRRVNEATSGLGTVLAALLFVVSLVFVVLFSSFAADTRNTHTTRSNMSNSVRRRPKPFERLRIPPHAAA